MNEIELHSWSGFGLNAAKIATAFDGKWKNYCRFRRYHKPMWSWGRLHYQIICALLDCIYENCLSVTNINTKLKKHDTFKSLNSWLSTEETAAPDCYDLCKHSGSKVTNASQRCVLSVHCIRQNYFSLFTRFCWCLSIHQINPFVNLLYRKSCVTKMHFTVFIVPFSLLKGKRLSYLRLENMLKRSNQMVSTKTFSVLYPWWQRDFELFKSFSLTE